jgi:STE24 endopeptidase
MRALSLNPARQEQARKYATAQHRLLLAQLAIGCLFLLALLFSGLSTGLRDLLHLPQLAAVALYMMLLLAGYGIVSAPFSFYRGFILPHRYGLSQQSLCSWLLDEAKGGLLVLALGVGLGVIIYQFLGNFPAIWWLLSSAVVLLITLSLTEIAPLAILPLFIKMKPLSDPALRQRLLSLAQRAGAGVGDIFVMELSPKGTGGNAMLAGLGGTRRIVLSDTLFSQYTPEELEVIVAHELGHYRHNDTLKLIGMQTALSLIAFYVTSIALGWIVPWFGFSGIADVAAMPLLVLLLGAFTLFLLPISNAYSRGAEAAADEYALRLTANPVAFNNMLTKLTEQNLCEAKPSRWAEILLYDHPPYYKRVRYAQDKGIPDEIYLSQTR